MHSPPLAARWPFLVLALGATVVLTAPLAERVFSDSVFLIAQASDSARPYYNLAYLPLMHAAVRLGGDSPELAMIAASRIASVLGGLAIYLLARRLGAAPAPSAAAVLLAWFAPGLMLFNALVEVHASAFAGAAWSFWFAARAGEARGARGLAWFAAAAGLALATHLSHLLLLPSLLWIADAERVLQRRSTRIATALTLGGLGAGLAWTLTTRSVLGAHPNAQGPLGALHMYARMFTRSLAERGLFAPLDVGRYLQLEWLRPIGVLALASLAALPLLWPQLWRPLTPPARRFIAASLIATLLSALLLSQGGVFEHGGYALSYLPPLAVGLALACPRRLSAVSVILLSALVAAQLLFARHTLRAFVTEAPDARIWAQAAESALAPGDRTLVSGLERKFALDALRGDVDVIELRWHLQFYPERTRLAHAAHLLRTQLLEAAETDTRVLLDAHLLDRDRPLGPWLRTLTEILADPRLRLTPCAADANWIELERTAPETPR